ncbi:MAG: DUF86 domain-containing protein [Peptococcaceae bacterium]|jgi:uncharacterized protein with HEPN domain|nr:DUF86 domain-containing protein [Peptococcaceae bacterium]
MGKGDLERISHIKRYCDDIAAAIKRFGDSFEVFAGDMDFYNSVSMSIMQIGELSGGLSDEFRDATRTQMPWGLIRGMRNHLAHTYATMDKRDIWETATEDIPNLSLFCEKVIENNPY